MILDKESLLEVYLDSPGLAGPVGRRWLRYTRLSVQLIKTDICEVHGKLGIGLKPGDDSRAGMKAVHYLRNDEMGLEIRGDNDDLHGLMNSEFQDRRNGLHWLTLPRNRSRHCIQQIQTTEENTD
jgi:hypothetical protein